ncbi:MAG: hypothetical protein AB7N71_05690 [Phycisphaerae bacterium]
MAMKKKVVKAKAAKSPESKRSAQSATTTARQTKKPATAAKTRRRSSWLDDEAKVPVIEKSAQRLESFLSAIADGIIDDSELAAQEKRLVKLMKEIEPTLDDATHAAVTKLLCELTAYDMMQLISAMQKAKAQSGRFRG